MDNNPWKIDCIEAFLFFNCPECAFIAKEKNLFQDHAKDNHPQSYVLFGGKIEKSEDHKTMNIGKCEPEDIEDDLSNDDQDQSQIENIEDFTGKYEEIQLSEDDIQDDTTDPLAVGKLIKFSNNSDLINLEETSDTVEGPEETFNNMERNAEDTPVDEKASGMNTFITLFAKQKVKKTVDNQPSTSALQTTASQSQQNDDEIEEIEKIDSKNEKKDIDSSSSELFLLIES